MEKEVSKEEWDEAVAESRHRELKKILIAITSSLSQRKDDNISAALEKQCQKIEAFSEAIRNLPKPQTPQININQDQVINSIQEMGNSLLRGLGELQKELSKPREKSEWVFEVKRHNYSDLIQSITAKQKN